MQQLELTCEFCYTSEQILETFGKQVPYLVEAQIDQ